MSPCRVLLFTLIMIWSPPREEHSRNCVATHPATVLTRQFRLLRNGIDCLRMVENDRRHNGTSADCTRFNHKIAGLEDAVARREGHRSARRTAVHLPKARWLLCPCSLGLRLSRFPPAGTLAVCTKGIGIRCYLDGRSLRRIRSDDAAQLAQSDSRLNRQGHVVDHLACMARDDVRA